jgi:sulfatase modifying factor 1
VVFRSRPIRRLLLQAWLCLSLLTLTISGRAEAGSYSTVSMGDYLIGTFEVTIGLYCEFLNAVASAGDPYGLYSPFMASDSNVAGIRRSSGNNGFAYTTMAPAGTNPVGARSADNRPISYVSWFDAARFANWMTNGQGAGSTETGAYTLLNGITSGSAPERNPGATYFIPSIAEWTKAAYGSGTATWRYATHPTAAPGNQIGPLPNQANVYLGPYSTTRSYGYDEAQNYLTDVGAFSGSPSPNGTYDQNGNVGEWTDGPGINVRTLGGSWLDDTASRLTRSGGFTSTSDYEGPDTGFRLGGAVVVSPPPPPPTEIVIDVPAGQTLLQSASPYAKPALDGSLPVRKTGGGTFIFDQANTLSGSLTIERGTALLSHTGAVAQSRLVPLAGGTVAIAAGLEVTVGGIFPLAGGVVDIDSGRLTTPELLPAAALEALQRGRGNGAWDGATGIRSSEAASKNSRGIGWIDNGNGTLSIAYAAPGDTDLDWRVDILDASNLLSSVAYDSGIAATWAEGDFNYDGAFDVIDVAAFSSAALYDAGTYSRPAPQVTAVPEPSTSAAMSIVVGAIALLTARRNSAT